MSSANFPPGNRPLDATLVPNGPAPPIRVVIEQGGLLGRFGRWIPWALLAMSVMVNLATCSAQQEYLQAGDKVQEKYHSFDEHASDKVAVVTLRGVIATGDGYIKQQIDRIRDDKSVQAIVLRIDSPGGSVHGSHYIYYQLKELVKERKIPLVVSMGSVAASGGYYAAMAVGANQEIGIAADALQIFAEPTTTTGSIGVILPHYNIQGLLKSWNVEEDSIKSHPYKDIGSMTRPMTDVERAKLQAYINEAFVRFQDVVRYGRPKLVGQDERMKNDIATGEVFTTDQAVKLGLVDKDGFLEDALKQAMVLKGLKPETTRVVKYEPQPSLLSALGMESSTKAPEPTALLAEMASPQPLYLWSLFPAASLQGPRAENGRR